MYTSEQQAEHRARLVAALRSGKYDQARHALRDEQDRYCCLGVACDISGLGHWDNGDNGNTCYVSGDERETAYLPGRVREWLGFATHTGLAYILDAEMEEKIRTTLAELNDSGKTFSDIADLIEHGKVMVEE